MTTACLAAVSWFVAIARIRVPGTLRVVLGARSLARSVLVSDSNDQKDEPKIWFDLPDHAGHRVQPLAISDLCLRFKCYCGSTIVYGPAASAADDAIVAPVVMLNGPGREPYVNRLLVVANVHELFESP